MDIHSEMKGPHSKKRNVDSRSGPEEKGGKGHDQRTISLFANKCNRIQWQWTHRNKDPDNEVHNPKVNRLSIRERQANLEPIRLHSTAQLHHRHELDPDRVGCSRKPIDRSICIVF